MIVYGVLELLTGYQQVINRLSTGMLITFWVGGWRGFGFVRTGLAPASEGRMAARSVAACLAPDGFAVGWSARRAWRWLLVALVRGWRLEAGGWRLTDGG